MNPDINEKIKSIINDKGIKLTKVSLETGIEYQRLNRLFNQHAQMLATELLSFCIFLEIDPKVFATDAA